MICKAILVGQNACRVTQIVLKLTLAPIAVFRPYRRKDCYAVYVHRMDEMYQRKR